MRVTFTSVWGRKSMLSHWWWVLHTFYEKKHDKYDFLYMYSRHHKLAFYSISIFAQILLYKSKCSFSFLFCMINLKSSHSKIFDIWSGACFRGLSSYFAPLQSYLLILRVVCPFCIDRQLNSLFQRITEILLNI